MSTVKRVFALVTGTIAAILVIGACGGHTAGSHSGGGRSDASPSASGHPAARLPAVSHRQIVRVVARDCEAEVKSLSRGSGAATPQRYQGTVDHFAAELRALADRDGNAPEADALRAEAQDLGRYAAAIGALPDSEYQHGTYLLRQPIKGELARTLRDSRTLGQRYGIVCIPAGG